MKALKAGRPLAVWVIAVLASSSDYSFGAGFGNDFQGCAFDRPCITGIYRTKAGGIFVKWTASDDYSHYNVRWSRPGKGPVQVEVGGGRQGSFHLNPANRGMTYTFAVQGCHKRPLQSSRCSPWETTTFENK